MQRAGSRGHKRSVLWTALISVAATLVVVFFVVNLTTGEKRVKEQLVHSYGIHDAQFQRTMGVLLGPVILPGNRFATLLNGDEIFPSMLQAIKGAQKTITFETYIYWSGEIGKAFADALSQRSRAGVKVHVLLDWVGSAKMDDALLEEMSAAGVQIRKFHPPHWTHLGRLNNRTHRKLLVVDGQVGYTGGVGIAPEWTGNAQDPAHWRDTHFRIQGPAVAQLQAVFLDNWTKVTGDVVHGPKYFPPLDTVGEHDAQMFSSSPAGGSESMQLMYLLTITAAARSIDLSAAYFIPDELTLRALEEAIRRGVRVRVVVPGNHIDSETVRGASRARWGSLLAAGALIAEYQPTMYHCKVMIVDGLLVSVGSTNFDNRSFRLNDEATLNIMNREFAAQQTGIFEADLAKARPISFEQWSRRPASEKLTEWVSSILSTQL